MLSAVRWLREAARENANVVGGKGLSLGILSDNGFNVPQGFVVVADVFLSYLKYNDFLDKVKSALAGFKNFGAQPSVRDLRQLLPRGQIPNDVAQVIDEALKGLEASHVAVRSSAITEDSREASFAGLYDTYLNVKKDLPAVTVCVKECWASLFNPRAIAYKIEKGLPLFEGMAVIVQEMVAANVSGTAFTLDPKSGDTHKIVVEASYGLGEAIVKGVVTPDRFVFEKTHLALVERKLGRKKAAIVPNKEGTRIESVSEEQQGKFCMDENLARQVARVCSEIEKLFSYPQDIEWCVENCRIWILQARPITAVEGRGDV